MDEKSEKGRDKCHSGIESAFPRAFRGLRFQKGLQRAKGSWWSPLRRQAVREKERQVEDG